MAGPARKPDAGRFAGRLNELLDLVEPHPRGRALRLARRYGVSQPTAHAWVHGKHLPGPERVRAMAADLGVSFEWLYLGDESRRPRRGVTESPHTYGSGDEAVVPIRPWIGRGSRHDAEQDEVLFRAAALTGRELEPAHLRFLRVADDAMAPQIRRHDTVVFDTRRTAVHDGALYVLQWGAELRVRRLYRELDGRLRVAADNRTDPSLRDSVLERDAEHFRILGRVCWVGSWQA